MFLVETDPAQQDVRFLKSGIDAVPTTENMGEEYTGMWFLVFNTMQARNKAKEILGFSSTEELPDNSRILFEDDARRVITAVINALAHT